MTLYDQQDKLRDMFGDTCLLHNQHYDLWVCPR